MLHFTECGITGEHKVQWSMRVLHFVNTAPQGSGSWHTQVCMTYTYSDMATKFLLTILHVQTIDQQNAKEYTARHKHMCAATNNYCEVLLTCETPFWTVLSSARQSSCRETGVWRPSLPSPEAITQGMKFGQTGSQTANTCTHLQGRHASHIDCWE